MSRHTILVKRPYDSVEAFLEGDSWTVDRADIVLVGADPLPEDSAVRFEIVLASGAPIVVGEGRVTSAAPAHDGHPAGLRVRLQKLNGSSKDVLKRALETRRRKGKTANAPEAQPAAPVTAQSGTPQPEGPAAPTPGNQVVASSLPAVTENGKSGVRNHLGWGAVPENRDALLARLRERAKTASVETFFENRRAAG